LIDGWLGLKARTRWLADAAGKSIHDSAGAQGSRPKSWATNLFGVRSQALRLFLPHMHCSSPINLLIPRRFGGQCGVINSGFAV
jgi:hypothetical protein